MFFFFLQQVIELKPDTNKLNYCIYQKPEVSNIIISSFCHHSLLSTPLTLLQQFDQTTVFSPTLLCLLQKLKRFIPY